MRFAAALTLVAALALAACDNSNDEQAEVPELNEYDSPVPEPNDEESAEPTEPPTEPTPQEQALEVVQDAANELATIAADQINELTDGRPLDEAAEDVANQVAERVAERTDGAADAIGALVGQVASQVEQAAQAVQEELAATDEVAWQSTYSPEVPFYNLGDEPVPAYSEPAGLGELVGTVEPGAGGFIETCNVTLDWCLLPFGEDGLSGWVDMTAFGGVAN